MKAKKGLWIGLAVLAAVVVLAVTVWVFAEMEDNKRADAEAVSLNGDLVVPFGEKARVSDFVTANEGAVLEDAEIDTERLGEVEVEFNYVNRKRKRRMRSFRLKVVDVTKPRIYGGSLYTVNVGYVGDLTDLMMSGDDLDDYPRREIRGEYDIDKVGEYELEYVVTDASGNETKKPFTLRVVKPAGEVAPEPTEVPKLEFAEAKRKYGGEGSKIGIDVSQWQGEIDWRAVRKAGVEFAMIRVGYQKGYGGEYVLDPYFVENMLGATEIAELPVGVYFYSYADSVEEARAQAEWVAAQISGFGVELGVAFDWEDWGNFNKARMSFWTINRVAEAFLDKIAEYEAETGAPYDGWLYGSKVYLERIWQLKKYPVWLAQYYDRVTYDGDYVMWQMSSSGRVNGIYGDVDIDILYEK